MSDESIDYRDLLQRYVTHVLLSEGSTFIGEHHFAIDPDYTDNPYRSGVPFSEAEQAELFAMDDLAWPIYYERSRRASAPQTEPSDLP